MSKLTIPTTLLDNLHCSICKNLLSIFPVYIKKSDGSNPICGRCKNPNESDYIRDEAYERLAQFLIYPCIEEKNGCTEKLTPIEIKTHETFCNHRKIACPSRNNSRCEWQGPNQELRQHFQAVHPNLIKSNNNEFQIQFTQNSKETYLIVYDTELFIFQKEVDDKLNLFTCSVQHILKSKDAINNKFNYYIRVQDSNNEKYHIYPVRSTSCVWDEKTRFTLEEINDFLHSPEEIVGVIEFTKTDHDEVSSASSSTPKMDNEAKLNNTDGFVDWDELQNVECPVCLEFMIPPIYQCMTGHSICSNCKPKIAQCPICKEDYGNTQNFTLEKIIRRMIYPCKYYNNGCTFSTNSLKILIHENACEFGLYECPLKVIASCEETCSKNQFVMHVEKQHSDFLLKINEIITINNFNKNNNITEMQYKLLKYSNRVFKICFRYEEEKFYWTVQLVGPTENSTIFKFEIDIVDNSERNLRFYIKGLCAPFTKDEECFTNREYYQLFYYDQFQKLINDNNFSFRIRILKD